MQRKKRKYWTSSDLRLLRILANSKYPAPTIGWKLRRTPNAVRQKAFSLGLSLETRPGALAA